MAWHFDSRSLSFCCTCSTTLRVSPAEQDEISDCLHLNCEVKTSAALLN